MVAAMRKLENGDSRYNPIQKNLAFLRDFFVPSAGFKPTIFRTGI